MPLVTIEKRAMKGLIFSMFSIAIALTGFSQHVVYDENAEVRSVAAFTGIDVSGTVSLYLSQGNTPGVAISAGEARYNNKIKTEVKNGILHISVDGGVWNGFSWTNRKLKAYVTATDLNRLTVSGASLVNITGPVKSSNLRVDLSGASEIKGTMHVENLNADISGASVAKLTGTAGTASINASGAARFNSYNLSIDNCKVSSSGASSVRLTATKEFNGDASGGSTIYYKGPAVAKHIVASAGSSIKSKSGTDD